MPVAILDPTSTSLNPRVLYLNKFRDTNATVSASSEATGFEKEFALDYKPLTAWKPSAGGTQWLKASFPGNQAADCFAFYATDLAAESATIKLQYSSDDSTWNDATSALAPTTTEPVYVEFSEVSAQYWRIEITSTNPVSIGVVFFGQKLIFERGLSPGFTPPQSATVADIRSARNQQGQFLHNSVFEEGKEVRVNLSDLTPAWIRSNWKPFADEARKHPFFFIWNKQDHPFDIMYAWRNDKRETPPSYANNIYLSVSMDMRGVME